VLFASVIGHATLKAKLIGNIREGRVAHAQLFIGPRGSGDLPLALAYAQYLLCQAPDAADACGVCDDCRQAVKLEHPDLHLIFPIYFEDKKPRTCDHLTPAWRAAVLSEPYLDLDRWRDHLSGGNKQLRMGVGIAQEIQSRLSMKSFRGGYKVIVVWQPELMDVQAANKLLKVLEEPMPNTVFLMVCNEPDQLLSTILSRTQSVKVPALKPGEVAEVLRVENPELSAEEAMSIALRSEGDLLEARSLVQQGEEELFVFFRDWLRACYTGAVPTAAAFSEGFHGMSRDKQKALMQYGLYIMRQCMFHWQGAHELVRTMGQEHEFVEKFAPLLSLESISGLRVELETAHVHIERNAHSKVLFMDLSYRLMALFKKAR
jgi:DNA polymerase-3 subunit delta'